MIRYALKDLIKWKKSENRKPLIIRGARQVGKTWLMKEFGKKYYEKTIYINFENNDLMRDLFSRDLDTNRIIEGVELANFKIKAESTLIIFDEIQECPNVITSLKYFYENNPELHIVCAGSLLGVAIHETFSFPVGKVSFLDLYPLTYFEFLEAINEGMLVQALDNPASDNIKAFKSKYVDLLKKYYYIGGMPEVVNDYVKHHDFQRVRKLQKNILDSYVGDFSKHISPIQKLKIDLLWESIPNQIMQEKKKFIYKKIKKGARAVEFEIALSWLVNCGLVYKVNRISKPALPIKAYEDTSAFKLFILDVGLLCALSNLPAKTIMEGDKIFVEFYGALTEQFILQQLKVLSDVHVAYWINESGHSELDFVIQVSEKVIPVEVKSGENLHAKSLRIYREKFLPEISIRASLANFEINQGLYNIPLYMINNVCIILKNHNV